MSYKVQNLQAGTLSEINVFNTRQVIIGGNNTSALSDDTVVVGSSVLNVNLNPITGRLFIKDNPVLIKENVVKTVAGTVLLATDLAKGVIEIQTSGSYTFDSTVNIRNRVYDQLGTGFIGSPRPVLDVTLYNSSASTVTVLAGTGQTFTNGVSIVLSAGSSRTVKMIFTSSLTMIVEDVPTSITTLTNASAPVLGEAGLTVDGTGPTLSVKKLVPGSNITLTNNANDVVIAATGGGSDVTTWGTWTPTIVSGLSSLTVNKAEYQRVGNKVSLLFDLSGVANITATSITLGGLPLQISGFGAGNLLANPVWIENVTDTVSMLGRTVLNQSAPNNVVIQLNTFTNGKSYDVSGQIFYTVFVPSATFLWLNWTPIAGVGIGSLTNNASQYQTVSTGLSIVLDVSFTANATGTTVTVTGLPYTVAFTGGTVTSTTVVENVTDVTSFVGKLFITGTTISVVGASAFTNTKSYNLQLQFVYPI